MGWRKAAFIPIEVACFQGIILWFASFPSGRVAVLRVGLLAGGAAWNLGSKDDEDNNLLVDDFCGFEGLRSENVLGPSWEAFWDSRGGSGPDWEPFGRFLGVSWAVLGAFWAVLRALGVSWGRPGLSWAPFGLSWSLLGRLVAVWGG